MAFPPRDEKDREYLENLSLRNHASEGEMQKYALSELNKIIFILGTGTFVLSISFIGYLKVEIVHPWFLIISWICFVGAISCNILAHLSTYHVSGKRMTAINKSRSSGFSKSWETEDENAIERWKILGNVVNYTVFIFLATGMLFLLLFAGENLLTQNNLFKQSAIRTENTSSTTY